MASEQIEKRITRDSVFCTDELSCPQCQSHNIEPEKYKDEIAYRCLDCGLFFLEK